MSKVSVVMPVYNAEDYLRRAVDSVLAQTLLDIELILVDDGSTDSSPDICDEYAQKDYRVKVIHQSNQGPGPARNAGMDASESLYIGFVDSDDYILPDMYRKMLLLAMADKAPVVKCEVHLINDADFRPPYPHSEEEVKNILRSFSFFPSESYGMKSRVDAKTFLQGVIKNSFDVAVWSMLLRKDIYRQLRFPLCAFEDTFFTLDLITLVEDVTFLQGHYYLYLQRPNSIFRRWSPSDKLDFSRATMKKIQLAQKWDVEFDKEMLFGQVLKTHKESQQEGLNLDDPSIQLRLSEVDQFLKENHLPT